MYIQLVDWFRVQESSSHSKRRRRRRHPFILPSSPQVTVLLAMVTVVFGTAQAHRWTEADESKRIADLKLEERRYFESQFGVKLPSEKASAEALDYGSAGAQAAALYSEGSPASLVNPPHAQHSQQEHQPQQRHHRQHRHGHHHAGASGNLSKPHWCFHCISPWSTISPDMRQVVLNLLELRRAAAPGGASVAADCTQPRDLNRLQRHACHYSYCQTLVLTDHENGASFTLRGCAENYGSIDEKLLESRDDNSCKKLHNSVDIRECVCKHRRYCYTGADRSLDYDDGAQIPAVGVSAKIQRHAHNGAAENNKNRVVIVVIGALIYILCVVYILRIVE